jgi:two-component system phosphate regulon response regulator PhoB
LLTHLRAAAIAGLPPELPALALTDDDDEPSVVAAFAAGADDVLAGPLRPAELAARVARLLRARRAPIVLSSSLTLWPDTRTIAVDDVASALSRREYELLEQLASAPGRLFTKSELMRAVWRSDLTPSRTLDRHVRSLRIKLGSRGAALVNVWGVGYRLDLV